jgi:hypothetical protein
MPRKPKLDKKTLTVVINGKPVAVTLHPPTGGRKSWYAYWPGLVSSKSTGQKVFTEAVKVAEDMVKGSGSRATLSDATLSDEEFEDIQRVHYAKKKGEAAQARAAKSLQSCLEAIRAFKVITGISPITRVTPDDCATFQRKALSLPKSTLRPYPKGKKDVPRYSANTVVKWSVALQAAWERACRGAGKKCVRGVVDESKLLSENPWRHFTWIEGYEKPIRQFDGDELVSLLDYLDVRWPGVTVAGLLAKALLWSGGRRAEVTSLTWPQLRQVGREVHFEVVGKWGVRRWVRFPEALSAELLSIRTDSPFVFAAYNNQLRQFYTRSKRAKTAKVVGSEFKPACLGDWFDERLKDWSRTLPKGHAHIHVFRKTALQYAFRGENASQEVAKDARVGEAVMLTHYVKEDDPVLREASNRTYQRILASLPTEVARRYGYFAIETPAAGLEEELQQAIAVKDWPRVNELSARLAEQHQQPTG